MEGKANHLLSDVIYWILHCSDASLTIASIICGITLIIIIDPYIIIEGQFMAAKARKNFRPGRDCLNCLRRIRKGIKGQFCTPRCEKRYYIKQVRQNYKGRKWHRNRLFAQSNLCGICTEPITNAKDATIDHIIPLSRGGRDTIENMQLAHKDCNTLKGNTYPGAIFEPDMQLEGDLTNAANA